MVRITVTGVERTGSSQSTYLITVKLSHGENEEVRTFKVFRRFLKTEPISGNVPAPGDNLSGEVYEALEFAEECSLAVVRAVSLLSYGDSTARNLTEKLRRKGVGKEAAEAAVRFCEEKRYIDEEAYLRRLMEQLCEKKHYGLRRIRQEIYTKGFSREAVEAVLEDCAASLDFEGALLERINKLGYASFSTPEKKKKQIAALQRYGFSFEEIKRALGTLQIPDEDEDLYFEE